NNHCAAQGRWAAFQKDCKDMIKPDPVTPPDPDPVKPVPDPAPASCYDPNLVAPRGPEVTLEQFIDGTGGLYRLTSFTGMSHAHQGALIESARVLSTAETASNLLQPQVAGTLTCKEFSQAPSGNLHTTFRMPIAIQRETGSIQGSLTSDLELYGPSLGRNDE